MERSENNTKYLQISRNKTGRKLGKQEKQKKATISVHVRSQEKMVFIDNNKKK